MKFNVMPGLKESLTTDKVVSSTPGMVLIKTLQLSPTGPAGASWTPQFINIDVPEANFNQFKRFLFQISFLGYLPAGGGDLFFRMKKNGGLITGKTIVFQNTAVTGTATTAFINSSATDFARITTGTTSGGGIASGHLRNIEITIDANGFDSKVMMGHFTTLPTTCMHMGTGNFLNGSANSGQYSVFAGTDSPGITLWHSSGNFAGVRPDAATTFYIPAVCSVYGLV